MSIIVRDRNIGARLAMAAALIVAGIGLASRGPDAPATAPASTAFSLAGTSGANGSTKAQADDSFEAEMERLHPRAAAASREGGCRSGCGGMRTGRGSGSGSGSGSATAERAIGCGGGGCGGCGGCGDDASGGLCRPARRSGSLR